MAIKKSGASYLGVRAATPPDMVFVKREPTTQDFREYTIGTIWIANIEPIKTVWMLLYKTAGVATWISIATAGDVTAVLGGDNINAVNSTGPIVTVNLDTSISQPTTSSDGLSGLYSIDSKDFLHSYGTYNTFTGEYAGNRTLTTATSTNNSAHGAYSMHVLTSGSSNTSTGSTSARDLTTGSMNTSGGFFSSANIQTGGNNSSFGANSLNAITTGNYNLALGYNSGSGLTVADSSNILIGHTGSSGLNNIIRIGTQGVGSGQQDTAYIAGIYASTPGATNKIVFVDSVGKLGSFAGTDKQLLVGVTGSSPIWGGLTSDGSITITNPVPGTIHLVAGAGDVTDVNSGDNIDCTNPGGPVVTVNLAKYIAQPVTNAAGTEGLYSLGGNDFLHNYGTQNTFVGESAGNRSLTVVTATKNTAGGYHVLTSLTTGTLNSAFGDLSLGSSTTSESGTALGHDSQGLVTVGGFNTSAGGNSLGQLVDGTYNSTLGFQSGYSYIGTESSNLLLSNTGTLGESNTIHIGTQGTSDGQQDTTYIAGIYGSTPGATRGLVSVDDTGKLGVVAGVDEQIIIGVTAGSPVWGKLDSADLSVTITYPSAGVINLATTGDITDVNGGDNINCTNSGGPIITVNLDKSIVQPVTNAAGTEGLYSLGANDFMHAYGTQNVFLGSSAGNRTLTTSTENTGIGYQSLGTLTTGELNTGIGDTALGLATTAIAGTAIGHDSQGLVTTGGFNSSVGGDSLGLLLTGTYNSTLGFQSGYAYTGTESDNICIGNAGTITESNTIHIGTQGTSDGQQDTTYIAGIYNAAIGATSGVVQIDSTGLMGSSNGANGYLLIGGGTAPTWASLGSSDGSITIAKTANAINLIAVGGGGGGGAATFITDTNSPAVIDVANITFAGAGILNTDGASGSHIVTTSITNGTNGQVIIGGGAAAAWGTITSTGGSITVSLGANTVNLEAVGAGGGATTFTSDSGNAVAAAGVILAPGGTNINTTGASNTLTVNLDDSLSLPATNAGGTEGLYSLDSKDFLHAYGTYNTFTGEYAGNRSLTTGSATNNSAYGAYSMHLITTAASNTSAGSISARDLTTGSNNAFFGYFSGGNIETGSNNSSLGMNSLNAATTGSNNLALGYNSGSGLTVSDSSNIMIGHTGSSGLNNTIRIGTQGTGSGQQDTTYIAGIYASTPGATNKIVFVDSVGKLGSFAGTDKQLLVGVTGSSPIWGGLTSDGSITITNPTPGTIHLVSAGGAGTVTTVNGGTNVTTVNPGGPTVTVNLDDSIALPVTNTAGTEGLYSLGGLDFLHNYGTYNTFAGNSAGNRTLTTGSATNNTAYGNDSTRAITTGARNTSAGSSSSRFLTSAVNNSNFGYYSGRNITTGGYNTNLGANSFNTATTGVYNVNIGASTGSNLTLSDSSNILISNTGTAGLNNTIKIGTQGTGSGQQATTLIAGIYGSTPGATNNIVFVDDTGKLGVFTGTDRQILVGVAGSSPIWGGLDSTDGSVTISHPTPGTINLAVNVGDITDVNGGTNINCTSSTGPIVTVNLDTSIVLPVTNASGTEGMYTLGVNDYMHSYGTQNVFMGSSAGNRTLTTLDATENTGVGYQSLKSLTTGELNSGFGDSTLASALDSESCSAIGHDSQGLVTTGDFNSSFGGNSLGQLTTGSNNLALGYRSGYEYVGGESSNISIGNIGVAAESNVIRIGTQGTGSGQQDACYIHGIYNTAIGATSHIVGVDDTGKLGLLVSGGDVTDVNGGANINCTNPTGPVVTVNLNDFINLPATDDHISDSGLIQINSNTILHAFGTNSIALGRLALGDDGGGAGVKEGTSNNTAIGYHSMNGIRYGYNNTAIGYGSLDDVVDGIGNLAAGFEAGRVVAGNYNTILGHHASRDGGGSYSIAIGHRAGFNGGNQSINIGNEVAEDYTVKMGQTSGAYAHTTTKIAAIYGKNMAGESARSVYVAADGTLGTSGYLSAAFLGIQQGHVYNATGDGSVYYLGATQPCQEVYDKANNYDEGGSGVPATFTAPVTGLYFLEVQFKIMSLYSPPPPPTPPPSCGDPSIITSNRTYSLINSVYQYQDGGNQSYFYNAVCDMDAGDTAIFSVDILFELGTKVLDIGANQTFCSGYMIRAF